MTPRFPAFGRVLLRLFAIQAAWNYERMLGVGFGYAVEPSLRALIGRGDAPRYREALARETRFFNAHPYLAGLAIGAAARAEADGAAPERIEKLREALCGPLGSLGDRLIWAGLLPVCSALALVLLGLGGGVWVVGVFLVLYNAVHVAVRVWGLKAGWRDGLGVAAALSGPALRKAGEVVGPAAGLLLGAALPLALVWQLEAAPVAAAAGAGALVVALIASRLAGRLSGTETAGLVLVVVALGGLLWP
jgi:PTS system mannose-specific IID component